MKNAIVGFISKGDAAVEVDDVEGRQGGTEKNKGGKNIPLGPKNVAPEYYIHARTVYLLALLGFCGYCVYFITNVYSLRESPAQTTEYVKTDQEVRFPTNIWLCPLLPRDSNGSTTHKYHRYAIPQNFPNGTITVGAYRAGNKAEDSLSGDADCILITFNDLVLKKEDLPIWIPFAFVWSQPLKSVFTAFVSQSYDLIEQDYIPLGPVNTSFISTSDIYVTRTQSIPLFEPVEDKFIFQGGPPVHYLNDLRDFDSTLSEFKPINCVNTTAIGCSEQLTVGTPCTSADILDGSSEKSCEMAVLFYFTFKNFEYIRTEEIDPVNWGLILAALGGFWIYVGVAFALFFREGTGGLLHPTNLSSWVFKLFCCRK